MIEMKEYFSEYFDIISKEDAKQLWEDGDRNFLILRKDGTDCYADCFESWVEIEENYPDVYFGLERLD